MQQRSVHGPAACGPAAWHGPSALTWVILVHHVSGIPQQVYPVSQRLQVVHHWALPAEAAALCPHKVYAEALRRLLQQLPHAAVLIAVIHLSNAVQVKRPAQLATARGWAQVGSHPLSNRLGEACTHTHSMTGEQRLSTTCAGSTVKKSMATQL